MRRSSDFGTDHELEIADWNEWELKIMNVIAVDDERMALELLVGAIMDYDEDLSIHMFRNPFKALEFAGGKQIDVAFLDINMFEMEGIVLAEELQKLNPDINIIFTTGYSDYAVKAFELHASGYITKPVTPETVAREMENLRNKTGETRKRVRIRCFGNFEVFLDNEVLDFSYAKTKELLAYLVDRKGAKCKTQEIMAVLWEDGNHESYLRNIRKDLIDTFKNAGFPDLIQNSHGNVRIQAEDLDCDYYDFLHDKNKANYHGEYMAQYSWAEITNAWLLKNLYKK